LSRKPGAVHIDTGAVFCGNLTLIQVQGEGA
ncbi:hypothetical protein ACFF5G_005188, partial [Escherichia coli]